MFDIDLFIRAKIARYIKDIWMYLKRMNNEQLELYRHL